MKKTCLILVLTIFICNYSFSQLTPYGKLKRDGVKYKIEYKGKDFDVLTDFIVVKLKANVKENELSNKYKFSYKNKLGFMNVEVPAGVPLEDYIQKLINSNTFESIEYNTIGEYVDFIPNDALRTNQWYLSAINMYKAWDLTKGNSSVIVGILDSGTDYTHEDIGSGTDGYNNLLLNGWNYATNTSDVKTTNYHGTFVGGIVAAKTNNNKGIAGVAGGNQSIGARILPYCVGISAPISSVIGTAIIDAVDKGAKIIQLSLTVAESSSINSAIEYAKSENVIVICAAGNDWSSSVSYPASNINVMAVGATDPNGNKANFSNYGSLLDVVAPGTGIYSTTLTSSGNYTTSQGTSFAAPQVSGVAALILSVNPDLTYRDVYDIIEKTAQKVGGYNYTTTSGRPNGTWNNQMGYGLVDAYAAVVMAQNYCSEFSLTGTIPTQTKRAQGTIQNATIPTGNKLTIERCGDIIINPDFEVHGELEIK